MLTREMFCHKFYLLDGGGGGDGGGGFSGFFGDEADIGAGARPGISDAEAAAFAESQGAIGLGTLGLTATEAASVAAQGVGAAHGWGQTPGPDVTPGPDITPGPGITTLTGGGGGLGGVEGIKEEKKPIVPEVTPEVTKEKEKEKEAVKGIPKAKKRQRRPTILTGEEGLMYTAPGKRRSLLGG